MLQDPYSTSGPRELSLADHLAIDRTVLANERTALAYGRTVLAMLVVGGTCLKFFQPGWIWVAGLAFVAGALAVAVAGWVRFRRTRRYLAAALERHTGDRQHPLKETVRAEAEAEARGTSAERPDAPGDG